MIRENADTARESRAQRALPWWAPAASQCRRHAQAAPRGMVREKEPAVGATGTTGQGLRHRRASAARSAHLWRRPPRRSSSPPLASHDGVTRLHTSHRLRRGRSSSPTTSIAAPGDGPPLRQGGVLAARARAAAAAVVVACRSRRSSRSTRRSRRRTRRRATIPRDRNSRLCKFHHRTFTRSAAASSAPSAATTRSCAAASPTSPRCSTTTSRRRGRSARRPQPQERAAAAAAGRRAATRAASLGSAMADAAMAAAAAAPPPPDAAAAAGAARRRVVAGRRRRILLVIGGGVVVRRRAAGAGLAVNESSSAPAKQMSVDEIVRSPLADPQASPMLASLAHGAAAAEEGGAAAVAAPPVAPVEEADSAAAAPAPERHRRRGAPPSKRRRHEAPSGANDQLRHGRCFHGAIQPQLASTPLHHQLTPEAERALALRAGADLHAAAALGGPTPPAPRAELAAAGARRRGRRPSLSSRRRKPWSRKTHKYSRSARARRRAARVGRVQAPPKRLPGPLRGVGDVRDAAHGHARLQAAAGVRCAGANGWEEFEWEASEADGPTALLADLRRRRRKFELTLESRTKIRRAARNRTTRHSFLANAREPHMSAAKIARRAARAFHHLGRPPFGRLPRALAPCWPARGRRLEIGAACARRLSRVPSTSCRPTTLRRAASTARARAAAGGEAALAQKTGGGGSYSGADIGEHRELAYGRARSRRCVLGTIARPSRSPTRMRFRDPTSFSRPLKNSSTRCTRGRIRWRAR